MSSDIIPSLQAICDKGYQHYDQQEYDGALRLFYQAWLKVPKPQHEYLIAATVLSGIGDSYYRMGKYELAIEALRSALACPKTEEYALILMRLGQSLLNTDQTLQATTYLNRAYRLSGNTLFKGEDSRYWEAITDIAI